MPSDQAKSEPLIPHVRSKSPTKPQVSGLVRYSASSATRHHSGPEPDRTSGPPTTIHARSPPGHVGNYRQLPPILSNPNKISPQHSDQARLPTPASSGHCGHCGQPHQAKEGGRGGDTPGTISPSRILSRSLAAHKTQQRATELAQTVSGRYLCGILRNSAATNS